MCRLYLKFEKSAPMGNYTYCFWMLKILTSLLQHVQIVSDSRNEEPALWHSENCFVIVNICSLWLGLNIEGWRFQSTCLANLQSIMALVKLQRVCFAMFSLWLGLNFEDWIFQSTFRANIQSTLALVKPPRKSFRDILSTFQIARTAQFNIMSGCDVIPIDVMRLTDECTRSVRIIGMYSGSSPVVYARTNQ